jgi:hypothetical protein
MNKAILIVIGIACAVISAAGIMHVQSNAKKEPVKFSIDYPPLCFITKSSGPPTWTYYIWIYEHNDCQPIKSGATLSICGDAVVSASVTGEALLDEFGAWQIKKVEDNYVTFEATKDAILRRSFEGFSITAPKSMAQAEVNWIFFSPDPSLNQYFGKDTGWGTQGTAWGPAKEEK